jgi:hypothetical protein
MSSCTVHEGPKPVVVIKGLLGTPEDQVAALEELKFLSCTCNAKTNGELKHVVKNGSNFKVHLGITEGDICICIHISICVYTYKYAPAYVYIHGSIELYICIVM